jgi:hypothetical protein
LMFRPWDVRHKRERNKVRPNPEEKEHLVAASAGTGGRLLARVLS